MSLTAGFCKSEEKQTGITSAGAFVVGFWKNPTMIQCLLQEGYERFSSLR